MTKNEEFDKWWEQYEIRDLNRWDWVARDAWNARQSEIAALKSDFGAIIERQDKNMIDLANKAESEISALRAEVDRLRKDAERFGILLREFMYCEVHSNEEIEEGAELIKRYRAMKEEK